MVFFNHHHDAGFFSDGERAFEKFFDLLRPRVGGDINVLRFAPQQKIAHAAANPVRGKAGLLQAGDDFFGGGWFIVDLRYTIYATI